MALTEPILIPCDPAAIVADMVAFYEAATGKVLHPAQSERMVINMMAYREVLNRQQGQSAGLSMLVSFSSGQVLDELGVNVGVFRLGQAAAKTTINFKFVTVHGTVQIPAGTRVASSDGSVSFATTATVTVQPSDVDMDLICECTTLGVAGNGYVAGAVFTILDPLAFVLTAENIDTSSGGADEETDDQYRERIKLAPESFSVAGPIGAYKFFAKSANASIIDVEVTTPIPGTVYIYPLVDGVIPTPPTVLAEVDAVCNGFDVRPVCDTVVVLSPVAVTYTIDVELTVYNDTDQVAAIAAVTDALDTFATERSKKLGRDVKRSQVIQKGLIPDVVYDLVVLQPAADLVLAENEISQCLSVNVVIVGTNNG